MISPDTKRLLEELGKMPYGKALKEFIDEELKEVSDITKIESWDDALARQKAIHIVRKLFSFMNSNTSGVDKKKDIYR